MSPSSEAEREHQEWLDRLKQIDHLLETAVPTLIRIAGWSMDQGRETIPLYVSQRGITPPERFLLAHALYSSTIQRLNQLQRRFAWMTKDDRKTLSKLATEMPKKLVPSDPEEDRSSLDFLKYAASELFGALNPLTSSEIFWAFIRAGESYAHSGVGFLTFFGILWSLERRYPDKNEAGAALEPSGPTATTTAKCLIAVNSLCEALRQRGQYYKRAAQQLEDIEKVAGKPGPHATWSFAVKLDLLAGTLFALSSYTVIGDRFVAAAEFLLGKSRKLRPYGDTGPAWESARDRITELLLDLDKEQQRVFADSKIVVHSLLPKIVACLGPGAPSTELREKHCKKLLVTDDPAYWADHASAAGKAKTLCAESLADLQKPFEDFTCLKTETTPAAALLAEILRKLTKSNFDVATTIENYVREPVEWCRRIINEETARASAGNLTDFDPAGLISAVTIAQKWGRISEPEAKDAIERALAGALADGSWMRGQPMFLEARILGIWPHTPDIVWMLAQAVNAEPRITVADNKLLAFVDWLERTQTQFRSTEIDQTVHGWSSELDRIQYIIDFWNTNVSVNALLEIRELIETRLWQICTRRFTTIRSRDLEKIAPVDLGAVHGKRLHRRLMNMARLTDVSDKYEEQDYAIVLHGPPGSSKTAIVEGLGAEMWKGMHRKPRIIRITPSDFTRQGEARLEYEARYIFELLSHVRGVTILFDEIDDFLRQRIGTEKPSFIQLITTAMLNRLQDLRDAAPRQQLCFILATNFIDKIEPALLRPGRVDGVIPVAYLDVWSRQAILEENLEGTEGLTEKQVDTVLRETIGWPWSTYNKLTKRIGGMTDKDLQKEIRAFRDQVQDSDYYYRDQNRWKKYSAPLGNEYVHLAFCQSKDLPRCRETVAKFAKAMKASPMLENAFDREAQSEGRAPS